MLRMAFIALMALTDVGPLSACANGRSMLAGSQSQTCDASTWGSTKLKRFGSESCTHDWVISPIMHKWSPRGERDREEYNDTSLRFYMTRADETLRDTCSIFDENIKIREPDKIP